MQRRHQLATFALVAAFFARPLGAQDPTSCPPPQSADSVSVPVLGRLFGLDTEHPVSAEAAQGFVIELANHLRIPSTLALSSWDLEPEPSGAKRPDPMSYAHTGLQISILVDTRQDEANRARFIARSHSALDDAFLAAVRAVLADTTVLPPGGEPLRAELLIHTQPVSERRDVLLFQMRSPRVKLRPATVVRAPPPPYPVEARNLSVPGRVFMQFLIDERGRVAPQSMRVVSSTHARFAESVLRSLPHYEFRPATINGCPVTQLASMPFHFSIR